MSDISSAFVAGVAGALTEGVSAGARERARERRQRRREVADRVLPALHALRRVLVRRDVDSDLDIWVAAVLQAYEVLEDNKALLPETWLHLKRSIRFAVGEATGLGFLDLSPLPAREVVSFDHTWLDFAGEYLDYVTWTIAKWGETRGDRAASSRVLQDYDAWLRQTGRYTREQGLWPDPPQSRT